jgi:hypothetical protein
MFHKRGKEKDGEKKRTHQFVPANNSHDAQRVNAICLRIKCFPPRSATAVAKDNIGMDVCVEILDAFLVSLDEILKGSDGLCVTATATAAIVGRATLPAIAVNVHVGEGATWAFDVNYAVAGEIVAAVGKA